jgi:malate dehydrogenase (oxaloacetate-decarboxylating)(NADP+)
VRPTPLLPFEQHYGKSIIPCCRRWPIKCKVALDVHLFKVLQGRSSQPDTTVTESPMPREMVDDIGLTAGRSSSTPSPAPLSATPTSVNPGGSYPSARRATDQAKQRYPGPAARRRDAGQHSSTPSRCRSRHPFCPWSPKVGPPTRSSPQRHQARQHCLLGSAPGNRGAEVPRPVLACASW